MSTPRNACLPARWILLASALCACNASKTHDAAASAGPRARYTVRAEVVAVPPRPGGELLLRHEAIPQFTDRSGAVVGMKSMVMPFPVPASLPLEGITPGDKIELVFSVDWESGKYTVQSVEKLPAATELKLGEGKAMGRTVPRRPEEAQK